MAALSKTGSATARLLGFRVRIPPGLWMSYSSKCCVLVEVSGAGLSQVQESSTGCVVCLNVIDEPRRGGQGPLGL